MKLIACLCGLLLFMVQYNGYIFLYFLHSQQYHPRSRHTDNRKHHRLSKNSSSYLSLFSCGTSCLQTSSSILIKVSVLFIGRSSFWICMSCLWWFRHERSIQIPLLPFWSSKVRLDIELVVLADIFGRWRKINYIIKGTSVELPKIVFSWLQM